MHWDEYFRDMWNETMIDIYHPQELLEAFHCRRARTISGQSGRGTMPLALTWWQRKSMDETPRTHLVRLMTRPRSSSRPNSSVKYRRC